MKRSKSIEEEMSVDKKLSAVVPCPMESPRAFGLSVMTNAPLAISKLRHDVRRMRLPQHVASEIIEDVISCFLSSGLVDGAFSSIVAEENAARVLDESTEKFRFLMSNMRRNVDEF